MSLSSYFFATPTTGSQFAAFIALIGLFYTVAIIAAVIVRRSGFIVVRRRARRMRSFMLTGAMLGTVYILARSLKIDVLSWRIWMYAILGYVAVRLVIWTLELRSLEHDKVVERQARQTQSYFRKRNGRPTRRKRRPKQTKRS